MPLEIAGRVRKLFLMDLPGSPSPPPEVPGVRVFRAGWYWKSNVCGAAIAGIGVAGLFTIVGNIFLWQSQGLKGRLLGAGMILYGFAVVWALLGGNWAAVYPYAVAIEQGKGFHFYTPFKELYIPTQEVKRAKWSWFRRGWVVRLTRRRGLLTGFILDVAWGRQARELVQAIGEELARGGRQSG